MTLNLNFGLKWVFCSALTHLLSKLNKKEFMIKNESEQSRILCSIGKKIEIISIYLQIGWAHDIWWWPQMTCGSLFAIHPDTLLWMSPLSWLSWVHSHDWHSLQDGRKTKDQLNTVQILGSPSHSVQFEICLSWSQTVPYLPWRRFLI